MITCSGKNKHSKPDLTQRRKDAKKDEVTLKLSLTALTRSKKLFLCGFAALVSKANAREAVFPFAQVSCVYWIGVYIQKRILAENLSILSDNQ